MGISSFGYWLQSMRATFRNFDNPKQRIEVPPSAIQNLSPSIELQNALENLYTRFQNRKPQLEFCDSCWGEDQISEINEVPVREIPIGSIPKLLFETFDHFESPQTYQYYLPRVLEAMGPPWCITDLYSGHLFETLSHLGFLTWNREDKEAVLGVLELLANEHNFEYESDLLEWKENLKKLRG